MTVILSIVGWHNAGKTTFLERLITELKRRGLRVATIKHTGGHFDMDHEGTDTFRYAQAGSDVVVISGYKGYALLARVERELSLDEIVARLPDDVDIILAEGFKRDPLPKIEIRRQSIATTPVSTSGQLLAIVTDIPDLGRETEVPTFSFEEASLVADLLQARGLLKRSIDDG